jgi:transposase
MERQYVGVDLHKRRSVLVRVDTHGNRLETRRIDNSAQTFLDALSAAGDDPVVVLEATCGWYWVHDTLVDAGCEVHLANPLALNWGQRRVKNDERDAADLVDMLLLGRLPEAWPAPPPVRELRELVRYRAKLVQLRSGLKSQLQDTLTKEGVSLSRYRVWGAAGPSLLAGLDLAPAYRRRVDSLLELIAAYTGQITVMNREIAGELDEHRGYHAILAIKGVGPVLAAVFVAEIGDVNRFERPQQLASWAGLTPKHRESDVKVQRGSISKQGSRLVRWAAIEAISRGRDTTVARLYGRVAERRGVNIARTAAARKLLHLVFYGLRDGEIRCLTATR